MQYEKHGKIEMTDQGLIIPALVVIVGQACSLKCKHCANFSPYAPNGTKRYTLEQIMSNLRLIFQSVCHIKKYRFREENHFCIQNWQSYWILSTTAIHLLRLPLQQMEQLFRQKLYFMH